MSGKTHTYTCTMIWTGNTGQGTSAYKAYARDHVYSAPGKPDLPGSADPAFRGDAGRYNPEELLVAALSSCHMLWYLPLCAVGGVVLYRLLINRRVTTGESKDVPMIVKPVEKVTEAMEHVVEKAYDKVVHMGHGEDRHKAEEPPKAAEPAKK